MVYQSLRKALFQMGPETAHNRTVQALKCMQSISWLKKNIAKQMIVEDSRLASELWGLAFPNPIGLAAGFDKDADVYPGLAALGFGFVEVGTITPRPQSGNPLPRLFRLPGDEAIINRMGFNNHGIANAKQTFEKLGRSPIPIGINLGKNKDTPNEKAAEDYILGLTELYPYGDYFVINVSSPNTKGLRDLQHVEALESLLTQILQQRDQSAQIHQKRKPMLLKIAPDLEPEAAGEIVSTAIAAGIDGIVATNTTLSREGLASEHRHETGGLSGKPLRQRSTRFIRHIYSKTRGRIPLVGVGGIFTGKDAMDKFKAGADLVQVYTGMIYRGPAIVKKMNQELLELMEKEKINHFQEWIGQDLN